MTKLFDDTAWRRKETARHHARLIARAENSITHRPETAIPSQVRVWTILFLSAVLILGLASALGVVS
jgi:hypothetical protein